MPFDIVDAYVVTQENRALLEQLYALLKKKGIIKKKPKTDVPGEEEEMEECEDYEKEEEEFEEEVKPKKKLFKKNKAKKKKLAEVDLED